MGWSVASEIVGGTAAADLAIIAIAVEAIKAARAIAAARTVARFASPEAIVTAMAAVLVVGAGCRCFAEAPAVVGLE